MFHKMLARDFVLRIIMVCFERGLLAIRVLFRGFCPNKPVSDVVMHNTRMTGP